MPSNRNIEQVAESKMADNRPLYVLLALERGSLLFFFSIFIPNYASFILNFSLTHLTRVFLLMCQLNKTDSSFHTQALPLLQPRSSFPIVVNRRLCLVRLSPLATLNALKFPYQQTYNADARASSLGSNIAITKVIWIKSNHMQLNMGLYLRWLDLAFALTCPCFGPSLTFHGPSQTTPKFGSN